MPSVLDDTSESFDAAAEVTVAVAVRGGLALNSEPALRPSWSRGGDNVAVGVVALLTDPPVLTATPDAPLLVCEPLSLATGGVDDDEVSDAAEGVEDAADVEVSVLCSADEVADDPGDESADESDGLACAIPCPEYTAAPRPSVISNPAK